MGDTNGPGRGGLDELGFGVTVLGPRLALLRGTGLADALGCGAGTSS